MEDAAIKYRLAIESARKHRFIHEEAVASEQAAVFHKEMGNHNLADELVKRALECCAIKRGEPIRRSIYSLK